MIYRTRRCLKEELTDVRIADTTNGITEPIPGTFTTGCLLPNVRGHATKNPDCRGTDRAEAAPRLFTECLGYKSISFAAHDD